MINKPVREFTNNANLCVSYYEIITLDTLKNKHTPPFRD
jgi:hypothetical protein